MALLKPTLKSAAAPTPQWLRNQDFDAFTANIDWSYVTAVDTDGIKILYSGTLMNKKTGTETWIPTFKRSAASTAGEFALLLNDTIQDEPAGAIVFKATVRTGILDTVNVNLFTATGTLLTAVWTAYGAVTSITTISTTDSRFTPSIFGRSGSHTADIRATLCPTATITFGNAFCVVDDFIFCTNAWSAIGYFIYAFATGTKGRTSFCASF